MRKNVFMERWDIMSHESAVGVAERMGDFIEKAQKVGRNLNFV